MEITLGALIAGLALAAGWLGKGWSAAKKTGADEAKTLADAAHHLKDFEAFKTETVAEFKSVREDFSKVAANTHDRIDKEKERRAEAEARQSAKMDELIKGQGVIEGQLSNMTNTMNHILERAMKGA